MKSRKITLDQQPVDVLIDHRDPAIIYAGCINGDLVIWDTSKQNDCDSSVELISGHHKKSCRSLTQSPHASGALFSCSKDRSIKALDLANGGNSVKFHWKKAHEHPINRVLAINQHMLASGDDEGVVRVWDQRKGGPESGPVREYHDNEDYIAQLELASDGRTLIAAGGDGYLSVFDIRKNDLLARSDNMETDIMCCALIKRNKRLVCGMGDGVLGIFNFGFWGDYKDRIVDYHDSCSIESVCRIDITGCDGADSAAVGGEDDVVCTASSDGLLRAIQIQPNRLLGIIGDHEGFPIERLVASADGRWLATCASDDSLRLWDVSTMQLSSSSAPSSTHQEDSDDDGDKDDSQSDGGQGESDTDRLQKRRKPNTETSKPIKQAAAANASSFFSGLMDSDNDDNDTV